MSNAGASPPPRPRVAITPLRPQQPIERARAVGYVVLGWVVTVVLVVATVAMAAVSLTDIRAVLAADLVRRHPESGTDAARAVDISLWVGAGLALAVVAAGLFGAARLWDSRRSGRTVLTIGAVLAVAAAVGFHLTVNPSAAALTDAGLPTPIQWAPAAAAVIAVIATAVTFTRSIGATLR
ncbi:hypothetical protein [Gordonia sp. 'Campus']|uniref:hypothetical protein n=1 Tax=Gordonia sp. 'Campus' TaxID=2915824 RepID=UPI001EE3A6B7|nr:hypothetical protein [Gordonia sp. 'Campus']